MAICWGDHHLWRKTYAYEGSAAIPFIIKLPENMKSSLEPGEKIEAPVELRDLLPTFLALNGCRIPERNGRFVFTSFIGKRESSLA